MRQNRLRIAALCAVLTIAAGAAAQKPSVLGGAAAQKPGVLGESEPGLWELTGVPGARPRVRECLGNLATLAQYEHRARGCKATTLSDTGKVSVIHYTCAGSDFGHTSIKVITPRNLKVDTQGISDGLPFAYTIEARRVGECKAAGGATERGH